MKVFFVNMLTSPFFYDIIKNENSFVYGSIYGL